MKYRMLEPGETLRNGDEVWLSGVEEWVNTYSQGKRVGSILTYRRPVPEEPSERPTRQQGEEIMKYRMLEPGEVVREGDEWLGTFSGRWHKTQIPGIRAGYGKYRRPVPEEPTDNEQVFECMMCCHHVRDSERHVCQCGAKLCPHCHNDVFKPLPSAKRGEGTRTHRKPGSKHFLDGPQDNDMYWDPRRGKWVVVINQDGRWVETENAAEEVTV